MDKAINFEGANVQVQIKGPDVSFGYGIAIQAGVKVYHFRFHVPSAASGGIWAVERLTFNSGAGQSVELPFTRYTQVVPNTGLIYPSTADIGVNPSQVQLLRTEAVGLQTRIRELKAILANKTSNHDLVVLLTNSIAESITALQVKAKRFRSLSADSKQAAVSQIFFDDLRISYEEAAGKLRQSARIREVDSVTVVSFHLPNRTQTSEGYPLLSQGVLRALEQNEAAYTTVANAQSLIFDLVLSSTPQGAVTALSRRGDEFKDSGHVTNCTIMSLPYAIWAFSGSGQFGWLTCLRRAGGQRRHRDA